VKIPFGRSISVTFVGPDFYVLSCHKHIILGSRFYGDIHNARFHRLAEARQRWSQLVVQTVVSSAIRARLAIEPQYGCYSGHNPNEIRSKSNRDELPPAA
jgi:hypothetical protein